MSEFVDSRIAELEEIYSIWGGSVAQDKEFALLKALKLAEEALRFYADKCNWITPSKGFAAQYDPEPSPIQRDNRRMLVDALAAIDALGKDHIAGDGKKVD